MCAKPVPDIWDTGVSKTLSPAEAFTKAEFQTNHVMNDTGLFGKGVGVTVPALM